MILGGVMLKKILFLIILVLFQNMVFGKTISKLSGYYVGKGEIIVNWCKQDSLLFDIKIDDNNLVTGKIGDAKIIKGKIHGNFFGSTKYIIDATLEGYLIKKENIRRNSIRIPCDFVRNSIVGGFHTSGSKFGGKKSMKLSGTALLLNKIKEIE